ncbi:helix-turn-helix transcriptional regulator [Halegenticoccus soli]|uniref:helix-turn-helix transcriptional regulator n=1 Tax=Halegenticoccus soli TaxID=1985678 RepID=UPI001E2D0B2F|nr:transcriptional regulator [Halegenticoccus soli]
MDGIEDDVGFQSDSDVAGRRAVPARWGIGSGENSPDPWEVLDAVSRRADFLAQLTIEPKHKPALQSDLGVSRSTVYKAIRELEELHLVERTDEGYRLSLIGRLLLEQYDQFCTDVESICRPAGLLSVLSSDSRVSVDLLRDAKIIYAERHAPHRPVRTLERILDRSTIVHGMSPVVLPSYIELFREQLVSGSLSAELVLGRPVVQCLLSDYRDDFTEALETGNLVVWETNEWLPFGLIVSEKPTNQVAMFAYDYRGDLRGLISNDSQRAVTWGRSTWEQFRANSTRVSVDQGEHNG